MSEEEAIEHCKIQAKMKKETDFTINNYILGTAIEIVLNKIQKQQKDIDLNNEAEIALNNRIMDLKAEIEKKDKIIDEIIPKVRFSKKDIEDMYEDFYNFYTNSNNKRFVDFVKQYFERKVEREDKQ